MNVTATLIGQLLTFAVLVWFIKAVLWEPMLNMMEERKKRIADGLAAGERGKREQELAEQRAKDLLQKAKQEAADVIAQAQRRGNEIVDEAKTLAHEEADRIKTGAQAEIQQELSRAREQLRHQVSALAVAGVEQILKREVDPKAHEEVLNELAAQL
jgi:F-type H+-transporting ATPase subunit b